MVFQFSTANIEEALNEFVYTVLSNKNKSFKWGGFTDA